MIIFSIFLLTVYPENLGVLSNLAKIWLSKSSAELQETLVEEKLRQSALKDDIAKYGSILLLLKYCILNGSQSLLLISEKALVCTRIKES